MRMMPTLDWGPAAREDLRDIVPGGSEVTDTVPFWRFVSTVAVAGAGSTFTRVTGLSDGDTSLLVGTSTVVSPTNTLAKSGVPMGFSVPAGFTSTLSLPLAVSVPSVTVNDT